MQINSIQPMDNQYTARLSAIAVMPKRLYYYGKMPTQDARFMKCSPRYSFEQPGRPKTVAIVGARKNTDYGKEQAYKIAFELAEQGVVIVSGLAFGIDSVAHRAALDASGVTIAVLGTPIDQIYPACHRGLAKEIVDRGGAIVSEYPRWEEVKKSKEMSQILCSRNGRKKAFLQRNRLISGLSDVVIVVEADLRSGSLNTAHHAFEQSNLVYAVPGDVTRVSSRGCNRLLGRGAMAFTEIEDVLLDLGINTKKKKRNNQILEGDNEKETLILEQLDSGVLDGEEIILKINQKGENNFDVSDFTVTIFDLQIKGRVKAMGENKWVLIK